MNKYSKTLVMAIVFIAVVMTSMLLTFIVSGTVVLSLLTLGVNKHLALGVAIFVAVATHLYIRYNHKIWQFLEDKDI